MVTANVSISVIVVIIIFIVAHVAVAISVVLFVLLVLLNTVSAKLLPPLRWLRDVLVKSNHVPVVVPFPGKKWDIPVPNTLPFQPQRP